MCTENKAAASSGSLRWHWINKIHVTLRCQSPGITRLSCFFLFFCFSVYPALKPKLLRCPDKRSEDLISKCFSYGGESVNYFEAVQQSRIKCGRQPPSLPFPSLPPLAFSPRDFHKRPRLVRADCSDTGADKSVLLLSCVS